MEREEKIKLGQAINLAHENINNRELSEDEFYLIVKNKYKMITKIFKRFEEDNKPKETFEQFISKKNEIQL